MARPPRQKERRPVLEREVDGALRGTGGRPGGGHNGICVPRISAALLEDMESRANAPSVDSEKQNGGGDEQQGFENEEERPAAELRNRTDNSDERRDRRRERGRGNQNGRRPADRRRRPDAVDTEGDQKDQLDRGEDGQRRTGRARGSSRADAEYLRKHHLDHWKVPVPLVDRAAFEEQTSTHPVRIKNVEKRFDNDKDERYCAKRITLKSRHKGFWKTRNSNHLEERTEIFAEKEIHGLPGSSESMIFQISADKSEAKSNQNSGISNIAFPDISSDNKERSERRTGIPDLSTTKK
jgi:hypothetical protein